MPRGMDDTFHRLLWITLVAVAFTFTVILTSVFVDIDDLLAKRSSPVLKQQSVTEVALTELPAFVDDFQEFPSNEDDTDENESTLRTKRSLESNNYLLRIKSPKIKKILTNRLATLLEELDEEESSKIINTERAIVNEEEKNIVKPKYEGLDETVQIKESVLSNKDTNFDKMKNEIDHNNVLHLVLHNILLQGIAEHLDINEVYKKVHMLIKSFEINGDSVAKEIYESDLNKTQPMEFLKIIPHDIYKEEDKFFNELIKCEKLRQQILQIRDSKIKDKKETANGSNMLIKTTIEIINRDNRENENLNNSNENITGATKILYNGKDIKSVGMKDHKTVPTEADQNTHYKQSKRYLTSSKEKTNTEQANIKESSLDQAITDYLNTHSIKFHNKYNLMAKGSFVSKRLKRQIKIRYLDDRITTEKSKRRKEKPKHHDDELYVEIETHFDGKGTKGEKKKKLVRSLIDKIQKAINSNVDGFEHGETVEQKQVRIKKRMQNPIEQNELIRDSKLPVDVVEHRQLNPISKTANVIQPLMNVLDKSGDTWKKLYDGPGFLAASKSLNSAEMRELDVDYNTVMENGIPKRLQKPLNTESEDLIKPNEYSDMGNVTLFLKDTNGSGFSIGINQYADEPPDKESLKIFTGLENLIQAYHQHYDQAEAGSNESEEQLQYDSDTNHEIRKRNINKQVKINKQWIAADRIADKEREKEKDIFGSAGSSQVKRSAINVKLFSNIKSKTKLNKFINTNAMPTKKIFHNTRRNKRQIDKIRIIASDRYPSTSREDIFLVSRENIYANRAVIKEQDTPEVEIGDRNEERYDFIAPYSYHVDIPSLPPTYISNTYDAKSLHTGLMSKYPHIFLENISRSRELFNSNPSNMGDEKRYQNINVENTLGPFSDDKNISATNVDEIVNAILPSRKNFKVVLKIFPKNVTNTGPGYKEVHTLINKSYDKNGVRYVSSLNVSEVSKFESLNKTKENVAPFKSTNGEIAQSQIKLLLELHKERIDQELKHLKMESQKLKEMIGHENINRNISYLINTFQQLAFKSSYGINFANYSNNSLNDVRNNNISNTVVPNSETTIKPLNTPMTKHEDTDDNKILRSIKQHENITRQILTKLDTKTNTLQLFLQKLIDQTKSIPQTAVSTEKIIINDIPKYVDGHEIHPSLVQLQTNFSNPVPFIYAFQHPLMDNKDKSSKTIANIIYHGHIHANKVQKNDKQNVIIKSVTSNLKNENINKLNYNRGANGNETKFFIDELENDFKLVSNLNDRIHVLTSANNNSTKS